MRLCGGVHEAVWGVHNCVGVFMRLCGGVHEAVWGCS